MISRLKSIRYTCILTKKIYNHTWIHCTQRAQAKTMPSVHTSSQFYIQTATSMPRGPTCARKLRYTGFTIVQLDIP